MRFTRSLPNLVTEVALRRWIETIGSTSGRAARTSLFLDDTLLGNGPAGSSHMLLNEIHTPRRKAERKMTAKTRNNGWKLAEDLGYFERTRTPF